MNRYRFFLLFAPLLLALSACQTTSTTVKTRVTSDDPIIQRFAQLATASVSDAVDQVAGVRGYMSHDIKPLFASKICGRAVTVQAKPSTEKEPPTMALELIDNSPEGRVLVIGMDGEDAADIAAFGGIMATGSMVQGFSAAVTDGGCRDLLEIREMGFPVFSAGIVPSSSVGRYVNTAKNIPVECGGVVVNHGDIICGDSDGIVVVPQQHAEAVLQLAEELEAKEAITTEAVKQYKSINQATQETNRI